MNKKSLAAIIIVGDEILLGQRQDTNSRWIAEKLSEIGLTVNSITTVGDNSEDIKRAVETAEKNSGIAIITGGLGPTTDDLTMPALADFFGSKIEFREDIYKIIKQRFAKRGVKLSAGMKTQAEFPAGAEPVENEFGSAPGIFFQRDDFLCFAVPGVPREMRGMLESWILPKIIEDNRGIPIRFKTFRTEGTAESLLAERIGPWNVEGSSLSFLPRYMGVDIRVSVSPEFADNADKILELAGQQIESAIGDTIYGCNEEELSEVIGRVLARHGWRVTVAESCTGGLLASMITDIPGASDYFRRGFITYSNKSKSEMLAVPEGLISKHGAVSAEVAAAMAEGAANWAKADFAISITGVAGPGGGTDKKPVGTTYIALLHPKGLEVSKFHFHDDRKLNRYRSARAALLLLYKTLMEQYSDPNLDR